MAGLSLPSCPPGREDGKPCGFPKNTLGFFGRGLRRWQPALLPPAGSHGHGEIWPSRPLRRGNLLRASRRDRSLKASQLRGPSPPPGTSSPRLRSERVNHWVGRLVLKGPIKRGQGPPSAAAAPDSPFAAGGQRSHAGSLPRPSQRSRFLSGYRAGYKLELKCSFSNPSFYFPFYSPLLFRSFPSLSGPVPRPSPAPTCQSRIFAWLGPCPRSFSHQCHWQMQICLQGCNSGQAPDRGGVSNSRSPTARSQASTPRRIRPVKTQNQLSRDI